jgi:DNA topoisomerase-1
MVKQQKLSHTHLLKIHHDPVLAAETINLVYISDESEGIHRLKKGNGWSYRLKDQVIRDKNIIQRIKKLAIPPAWENVWICHLENGHLQATGYDARSRKQYRYHPLWNYLRNETKYHHLLEFGKALPNLRLRLEKDLALKDISAPKVIATVISLMERTYIRVGNESYEKMNGSFGLTTLKDKHVNIEGDALKFSFKGKKGIYHDISLKNKKLAKAVKECRDIPGKELFQYYDESGQRKSIDSGMVNNYIREAMDGAYSAKDIRTWAGSLNILHSLSAMENAVDDKIKKQNINKAIDEVSLRLGNTRTVCRKYYIHPAIISLYEENKLDEYMKELNVIEKNDNVSGLTSAEKILMKILETAAARPVISIPYQ